MEFVNEESRAVDIVGNSVKILLDCKDNGEVLSSRVPASIYMVPSVFRDLSPSSFNPRVVSIGPLHRKDKHLQVYEVQKAVYLHKMLHRLGVVPKQALQECTVKVIYSIERIKACYVGLTTYNDIELANMMVIDGCFILEFIQGLLELSPTETNMMITDSIAYDLLLIENQIPFFVLEIIFECTFRRVVRGASFTTHMELLLRFYKVFVGNFVVPNVCLTSTHDHILGFVHKYYQPLEPMPPVFTSPPKGHSAMDSDRSGMNFKPIEDQNWVMAMKLELPSPFFTRFPIFMVIPQFSWIPWPTLRMPIMHVADSTELILRNLIIYEQFSEVRKYITSYVYAMDLLINTPQDVVMLMKAKVLANYLGSNENAANMINNVRRQVPVLNFIYDQQWKGMDAYYNSYWPHTVAGLKRTYFSNPWNIIALLAAFVLFALTVVQTIFSIKAA